MYSPPARDRRRLSIHRRIRKKVRGGASRPRLAVFRSLKHIYAQLIDDDKGRTLAMASSRDKDAARSYGGNIAAAADVGTRVAERAAKAGFTNAIFDRGGHRYHGRVKALADAARKAGLRI